MKQILPVVTPYLDEANAYTGETVARPILRLVFGDQKVTDATTHADLTAAQRECGGSRSAGTVGIQCTRLR